MILNVAWVTVPLTVLALILISPYHLMLFQFHTCTAFPSDYQTHVVCDQTPLTVGTTCTISCPSLYWSTSFIHSSCTWRGVWNVTDSTCKPQAAVLIGQGWNETSRKWESITHMYPQTDSMHLLPGLSKSGGTVALKLERMRPAEKEKIESQQSTKPLSIMPILKYLVSLKSFELS